MAKIGFSLLLLVQILSTGFLIFALCQHVRTSSYFGERILCIVASDCKICEFRIVIDLCFKSVHFVYGACECRVCECRIARDLL